VLKDCKNKCETKKVGAEAEEVGKVRVEKNLVMKGGAGELAGNLT
jgi:hypothetical protein